MTDHSLAHAVADDTPTTPPPGEAHFLPRQPSSLKEASLDANIVQALILKFLYIRGSSTGQEISEQLKLSFSILERELFTLKTQMLVGYRGASVGGDYQYELSPKGVETARGHVRHCSYCGSAPVSIEDYLTSVARQSLKNSRPKFDDMARALDDLVVTPSTISQVGQAVRAGKGLFLFGAPGNGKTSIAQRLVRAIDDSIWIPRALVVGGEVMRLYDPHVHDARPLPESEALLRVYRVDERWVRIARPTVVVGGELSLSHLEPQLSKVTGIIEAPVHLKSNSGCLVVDDFGRQRVSVIELLNRWIVPLECGYDHLSLPSGRQLTVPFDQLVVFSTNLEPSSLCDEAFLRRIPYKVEVLAPTEVQFRDLLLKRITQFDIDYEPASIDYLLDTHYTKANRPLRFCHVNDILNQVREYCDFHDRPLRIDNNALDMAVTNYFAAS